MTGLEAERLGPVACSRPEAAPAASVVGGCKGEEAMPGSWRAARQACTRRLKSMGSWQRAMVVVMPGRAHTCRHTAEHDIDSKGTLAAAADGDAVALLAAAASGVAAQTPCGVPP